MEYSSIENNTGKMYTREEAQAKINKVQHAMLKYSPGCGVWGVGGVGWGGGGCVVGVGVWAGEGVGALNRLSARSPPEMPS